MKISAMPATMEFLERPPEWMRPDRPEVMTRVGFGAKVEIAHGVRFECLVGAHTQARQLTTGLVTFAPGAELPYHTHPFSEAITLLQGRGMVEVEGRCYQLGPLDNIVVPRATAHAAKNMAADRPVTFHIAMATSNPTRTSVDQSFPHRPMPASAVGPPGGERLTRFAQAPRFPPPSPSPPSGGRGQGEGAGFAAGPNTPPSPSPPSGGRGQGEGAGFAAGPNTDFIDFFNAELMPGLEMSGGYALFHPGGRLPAHVHDFDESICIIDGQALCIVEGRRYTLSEAATALVPRGRVHYFHNETNAPMAMLWVYAGPLPQRLVVAEQCATLEGNPWQ